VNVQEGVALCNSCGEAYPLKSLVSLPDEPQHAEMPPHTKVLFTRDGNERIAAVLPRGVSKAVGCFLVPFTIFWNAMSWGFAGASIAGLFSLETEAFIMFLCSLPFVAVGLVLLGMTLFVLMGNTCIAMDRQNLLFRWQLRRFKYDRRYDVADIIRIGTGEVYKENDVPKLGLGFFLKNKTLPMAFGSGLSHEERDWLVWEFYDFWKAVRDRKNWP
jgi:hypothetical protein